MLEVIAADLTFSHSPSPSFAAAPSPDALAAAVRHAAALEKTLDRERRLKRAESAPDGDILTRRVTFDDMQECEIYSGASRPVRRREQQRR